MDEDEQFLNMLSSLVAGDDEDQDDTDKEDEDGIHKCQACKNQFKPSFDFLRVSNCPNFDGNLQHIEGIKWLSIQDYKKPDLSTLKLPADLEELELRNMPNATNADKLVLPFSIERLKIENVPNARNLKIPLSIEHYSFVVSTDSEAEEEAEDTIYNPTDVVTNATDYYDLIHLIIEPYTESLKARSYNGSSDEIAQFVFNFRMNYLRLNGKRGELSTFFKRKCTNLNWLMSNLHGWDWNLNVIIDNYCGFFIDRKKFNKL